MCYSLNTHYSTPWSNKIAGVFGGTAPPLYWEFEGVSYAYLPTSSSEGLGGVFRSSIVRNEVA